MHSGSLTLVDEHGRPLDPRLKCVLVKMLPRFRRQFPAVRDDVAVVEILEESARRIMRRERRLGAIENLAGYAWVTVRAVAASKLRRGDARLMGRILPSEESEALLSKVGATVYTATDIERSVLLEQVLTKLTPTERRVFTMKEAGYSTREIARIVGRSVTAVDTLFWRAKMKARRVVTTHSYGVLGRFYPHP